MDNESEVIHQQMQETRTALQDKLETLEQQVKNTVADATAAVSDTVETVKDAVHDTVETVQGTVQSVKDAFNLVQQVEAHPLAMFLGATAVGFLATRWLLRATGPAVASPRRAPLASPATRNGGPMPSPGYEAAARTPAAPPVPQPPRKNPIAEHYSEELAKLKGLAVGTIGGLVRELLTSSVAPAMAEQIKDVVNGITVKMGGHLMESPILQHATPDCPTANESASEQRGSTQADRTMTTTH